MKRTIFIISSVLALSACSQTTTRTTATAPVGAAAADPWANAHGNYLELAPAYRYHPRETTPAEPAPVVTAPDFDAVAEAAPPASSPVSEPVLPSEMTDAPDPITATVPASAVSSGEVSPTWSDINEPGFEPDLAPSFDPEPEPVVVVDPEPEPVVEPAPRPLPTADEVLRVAETLPGLAGWTVIPLAQLQRDNRFVVVAWPALNASGQVVDATVVGLCLEATDAGEIQQCGDRWAATDQATSEAAIERALGGSDYEVLSRHDGVAIGDLGTGLVEAGNAFTSAVSRGDRGGARRAALALTRLLPFERVALDNDIAQLLYLAARYNGQLEHAGTQVSGDRATLTFHVSRGWLRLRTIQATAERVVGSADRWIITSYR